jgi:hypothetical protein
MIDPELAAFLEGSVAIHLASRNEHLEPNGARVVAVKVDPDGRHITAYVPKVAAPPVMADLESNRQAAIGFGRPTDDRACQVKGEFVDSRTAPARDRAVVERQWQALLDNLAQIGIPPEVSDTWPVWPCVAIRVRVTALFSQTPGPGAGAPLR